MATARRYPEDDCDHDNTRREIHRHADFTLEVEVCEDCGAQQLTDHDDHQ